MGTLPAKRVAAYFEAFKGVDVTFTKDMIQVTGLIPDQVHLKCGSDFWPCVFFATSFERAKVVVNVRSGILDKLSLANNSVSLRLSFKKHEEKGRDVTFFVAGRVMGTAPYKGSEDVALLALQFTQRPPDDFIEIIGRILDANINSAKRKDERILLNDESQRKLKLFSREATVHIQKIPRRCIIRDLSFSGAKLIMMGVGRFLVEKQATLRVDFDDPREGFMLTGTFIRSEEIEGKQGMAALAMSYDESQVPMGYKIRINEYLNTVRADSRVGSAVAR
ncbi:MAG: PilZ domain-containing protein [Treponema sp.]|nr:PilZ domain-containing protein [Treponema sp.]